MSYLDKRFCVYKHINRLTGVVRYIGSGTSTGINPRPSAKSGRNKRHLAEWDELDFVVIKDNLTKEEALQLEAELVNNPDDDWNLLNAAKVHTVALELDYNRLSENFEISTSSPSGLVWKVDKSAKSRKGEKAGNIYGVGYYQVCLDYKSYLAHRVVWCLHNKKNLDRLLVINHIDGNKGNNSPANLEAITQKSNTQKRTKLSKFNRSGVNGVAWKASTWKVRWNQDGVDVSKTFNPRTMFPEKDTTIAKEEAFRLACEWRKQMEELHYNK